MADKISEVTGHVSANDGTQLFFRHHRVENEKAGILIVHGIGEHSGRYRRLTEVLNADGASIFSYDHRGHGLSSGKRGHVDRFQDYINDLELMMDKFRSALSSQVPFFLLGHSMGGLIVLNYAQQGGEQVDGVIVSAPGLKAAIKPPGAKILAARVMSVLAPSFSFDNELDPTLLSHDEKAVDSYVNDPLVHRQITARWGIEFMKTAEHTLKDAPLLKTPVLMQVAGDDRLVSPEACRVFFQNVSSEDKTLRFYDGLYHEIYNENEDLRKPVISDLQSWLNDHL